MNLITSALRRAWGDISGFVTVLLIMLLAYSIAVSVSRGNTFGQVLVEGKASCTVAGQGYGETRNPKAKTELGNPGSVNGEHKKVPQPRTNTGNLIKKGVRRP